MVDTTPQPRLFKYLFSALAVSAIVLVVWQVIKSGGEQGRTAVPEILQIRRDIVKELELVGLERSPLVDPEGGIHFGHPPTMTSDDLMLLLRRILRDYNLILTAAVHYEERRELYVEMSTPRQEMVVRFTFKPRHDTPDLAAGVRGRIALIIDDFGYMRNRLTAGFMELDEPLTYSVIPGRRFSQVLASEALNSNHEVIVHMPLEPEQYNGRDEAEYILLYGMDPLEVQARVRKAFQHLPQAVGMNNHEGSLATLDTALLQILAEELLERNKYFVDSFTSSTTRGLEVMQKNGVPSLGRQVFIDNIDEPGYIRQQLAELAASAERRGFAIGIGHVGSSHLHTLDILREEIPRLKRLGFEFVFASALMPDFPF